MTTKTEIKRQAQEHILCGAQIAFTYIHDDKDLSVQDREDMLIEASKQFARVERLFDYIGHSWARGV